jgi:hypothetical protein
LVLAPGASDEVTEEDEAGGGIVEGIVPGEARAGGLDFIGDVEGGDEVAKAVGGQAGMKTARDFQCIDPGAEAMGGKGAKEALFGGGAVGDDKTSTEVGFNLGPESGYGGRVVEVFGADAVDLPCRPGHGPVGLEVGAESELRLKGEGLHAGDADLDRSVGSSGCAACGFEINGGKGSFIKTHTPSWAGKYGVGEENEAMEPGGCEGGLLPNCHGFAADLPSPPRIVSKL